MIHTGSSSDDVYLVVGSRIAGLDCSSGFEPLRNPYTSSHRAALIHVLTVCQELPSRCLCQHLTFLMLAICARVRRQCFTVPGYHITAVSDTELFWQAHVFTKNC